MEVVIFQFKIISSNSTPLCLLFHNFYPINQPNSKKNITDGDSYHINFDNLIEILFLH